MLQKFLEKKTIKVIQNAVKKFVSVIEAQFQSSTPKVLQPQSAKADANTIAEINTIDDNYKNKLRNIKPFKCTT